MRRLILLLVPLLVAASGRADIGGCVCDPAQPATLEQRECALTREAMKQPPGAGIFFLKDVSPRKQQRTLALPCRSGRGLYRLSDLTAAERLELWMVAIEKAKELWGEDWGVAVNGDKVRTQCHPHVHIGKFLKAAEKKGYAVIRHPREIPVPDGDGLWVHPVGKRMHVHRGEQICETVLLR